MAIVEIQRPRTDYAQLGALLGQMISPQEQIQAQLLPLLFKAGIERQQSRELLKELRGDGLGDYKIKFGAGGTIQSFEKKTAKEKLEDKMAERKLETIETTRPTLSSPLTTPVIPSQVLGATPSEGKQGQRLEATAYDEFGFPIKYEPTKGLPAESGSKLTMLQQAISDLDIAENMLFKDGKFLRGLAFRSNVPGGQAPFLGRIIPDYIGGRGTIIGSAIENALEAKLRIETGAAATQDEYNRIRGRFAITSFDTAKSAKFKITRLRDFMKNATITIDPQGKFVYQTGDKKLDAELNLNIPEGWEVVD